MSIEHSQILVFFCTILLHSFCERSGPGPLGPVWKILVVRSSPEGPQFPRSVGTLLSVEKENIIPCGLACLVENCLETPGDPRTAKGSPDDFRRDNIAGPHGKYSLKQARKGFRPPSAMKGIGCFQNLRNFLRNRLKVLDLFWNFFGIYFEFIFGLFWEHFLGGNFLGGMFLEEFLGRIFLVGFFGRIFLGENFWEEFFGRNSLFTFNCRFGIRDWGNYLMNSLLQGFK